MHKMRENTINSKIATVPKYEREFRVIQRQQQIKEALYLYLLQKREETNIALAVTVANAKIIDKAYSNGEPVAPKKDVIYLASLFIGLIVPVLGIYIRNTLDTKVHSKKDTDKFKIPFIGEIPFTESKSRVVVTEKGKTVIAEAFRLLRTNTDFVIGQKDHKVIFVTSTIGKEGKTFVSINLAASIALTESRGLLGKTKQNLEIGSALSLVILCLRLKENLAQTRNNGLVE